MSYTKRGPFVDASPTGPYVDAAFFNNLEAALLDAVGGVVVAPAPTGVAATDTANLQTAISAANSAYADLVLAPAPGGTVKNYLVNTALSWNLNRGNIRGRGLVGIDFSAVSTGYSGAAFTLTTNAGNVPDGGHQSATHRVQGIRFYGHNTDTSTMDGIAIVEGAPGFGNDQGIVESCMIQGFRDNLIFGNNVWSFDFRKVAFATAHRYNINLTGGTGECQQFTECNVYGASNAAGTAANLYMPAGQTIDARFYGGSFDYPGGGTSSSGGVFVPGNGGIQGIILGGSVSFDKVHIEDANTGPMFTYVNTVSGNVIDATFRDCFWSSTNTASVRDHLHEIQPSTKDRITVRFEGDKGSVSGISASKWIVDNSGLGFPNDISVTYRGFGVVNNAGVTPTTALSLVFGNMLTNGNFDASTAFVAANGLGWTAGAVGTWTIGSSNARSSNALQIVSTGTTGTNNTIQRVRIPNTRQPIRVVVWQQVTAYTSGSVGTYIRFTAEDGTTQIGSDVRVDVDESATTAWRGKMRRLVPPPGAAFASILCNANSFNGTAQWDDIEVVAL